MARKLLHHPVPYSDESPGSLLIRTTEYNGWRSTSALLIALNYKLIKRSTLKLETLFCDQEKWKDLCDLLNREDNAFISKCYRRQGISIRSNISFKGVSIPWKFLRISKPAICPKCIAQKPYQKSIWDLSLITACTIHNIKLIDTCPSCYKNFIWNRKKIVSCSCGFNITNCQTEDIDTTASRFIEQALDNKNSSTISLILQYADVYKEFFEMIGELRDIHYIATLSVLSASNDNYMSNILLVYIRQYMQSHALHPRITLSPFLFSKNKVIIKKAKHILLHLEKYKVVSNYEALDKNVSIQRASAILGTTKYSILGLISQKILIEKKDSSEITLDSIKNLLNALTLKSDEKIEGISSYSKGMLAEKVSILIPKLLSGAILYSTCDLTTKGISGVSIARRPEEKEFKENKQYCSLLETAQICNVHYENIRFAVKCGIIERVDEEKTKGTQIFIEKQIAYQFDKLYVFSGNIALEHGLNHTTIAEKLMASGISPISGPKIDSGLTYLFRRKDIKNIDFKKIDSLRNYPTRTGRKIKNNTSCVDYSISIASAANILDLSVNRVTSMIQKGHLEEYNDIYRRKSITYESFQKIFEILNNPNYITLEDVAKNFQITKRKLISRYIRTEIITTIDIGIGVYISGLDFKKLKKFNNKYITSSEAGQILGGSDSILINLRRTKKIETALELKFGSNIKCFFDRSKVLALKN